MPLCPAYSQVSSAFQNSSCSVTGRLSKRHSSFLTPHIQGKAPLLHRHYPASSLLWASPTPTRTDHAVIDSPMIFENISLSGAPRFLDHSFATCCPLSPRQAEQVRLLVSSLSVLASPSSGGWPPATSCFEAETGSPFRITARSFVVRHFHAIACFSFCKPALLPVLCCLHTTDRNYMSNQQFT
jgi:hypothetical protein